MARSFDGATQSASIAANLSGTGAWSISFWMKVTTWGSGDFVAFEYTPNYNTVNGAIMDTGTGAGSRFLFGMHGTGGFWTDEVTLPSVAQWHHYLLIMDRVGPSNVCYIDGTSRSFTAGTKLMNAGTSWDNSSLFFMARNNASLWRSGSLHDVAVWTTALGQTEATQLYNGVSPLSVGSPVVYVPLPLETNSGSLGGSMSLTGSPPVVDGPGGFANTVVPTVTGGL